MINFNFDLSDEDAELLFDCVQSRIVHLKESIYSSDYSEVEKKAIEMHICHLNDLKGRMVNSRK